MYLTVLTGVNGIVQLITVAVLFIIVLVMTYFTTRFIGNYQKGHLSCTNIQIIDTMRLSQNKLIQIVRTGDKYFAIAVCKDTVTLLGEIMIRRRCGLLLTSGVTGNIGSLSSIDRPF